MTSFVSMKLLPHWNMEFEVTYFCVPGPWTLTFSSRINSFLASLEQEPLCVLYITLSSTPPARDIQPHLTGSDRQLLHTVTLLTEATFWEGWLSGKDKHWLYHLWLHSNFKKKRHWRHTLAHWTQSLGLGCATLLPTGKMYTKSKKDLVRKCWPAPQAPKRCILASTGSGEASEATATCIWPPVIHQTSNKKNVSTPEER